MSIDGGLIISLTIILIFLFKLFQEVLWDSPREMAEYFNLIPEERKKRDQQCCCCKKK